MRKKDDTLQSTLLNSAREIADTEGISAVNIRSLAEKAGVASGTVYNYFPSKDAILLALTEEYWKQTLLEMDTIISKSSFYEQLLEIFAFLKEQISQSAGKLMDSLGHAQPAGQMRMSSMHSSLEISLIRLLEQDKNIRKDIWNDAFTKEQFAHFIMTNIIILLKENVSDITFFITIIKKIIY